MRDIHAGQIIPNPAVFYGSPETGRGETLRNGSELGRNRIYEPSRTSGRLFCVDMMCISVYCFAMTSRAIIKRLKQDGWEWR